MPQNDYASIDDLAADYEFFGEPGSLMDMRILKGHGIAALAGAGGALLTQALYGWEPMQTFFADKPGYMALAQFLLGVAGGRAIYHFEGAGGHPAAYGFVGQVSGSAAAGGAMMLYHQYGPAAAAPDASAPPVEGLGYTGVRQVAPYYDRYKVSVPRGTSRAVNGLGAGGRRGLSGEEVTQSNYFQTNGINGLGQSEEEQAAEAQADDEGQPGWPADDASPEVGTWIS